MKGKDINAEIRKMLTLRGTLSSGEVAREAGVSRQAAHYHLRELAQAGVLVAEGAGRSARYAAMRVKAGAFDRTYQRQGLEEDQAWKEVLANASEIAGVPENARSILQYAFTELVNNAVEHSGSTLVEVSFETGPNVAAFAVKDDGEGVFEHVRRLLNLGSGIEALAEITKGKVTTLPETHTGEGLFFVSKIADLLEVDSGGLKWLVDNLRGEQGFGVSSPRKGTWVRFEIDPGKGATLKDLFDQYTRDFAFVRTRAVVKLFAHGVSFVSRSEARRLLRGLDKFLEVVMDFAGVDMVGQGFTDEVFRVWARAHPEIKIETTGMNEVVAFMVERARRHP